jgi:threonine/homoserine/homoserine lactone efflux protein
LTWWIGLFSLPPAIYFTAVNQWIFGISAVASIFITEVAIAWGSGKVKSLLNEQFMKRLNTGMGVLFMGIGVYMIVSVLV